LRQYKGIRNVESVFPLLGSYIYINFRYIRGITLDMYLIWDVFPHIMYIIREIEKIHLGTRYNTKHITPLQ